MRELVYSKKQNRYGICLPNPTFAHKPGKIMKQLTITLCLALCATFAFAQKKGKPLYKAEFGIQAYTFRNSFPKNPLATLDTIKAMGFTEMEGGGIKGMTLEEVRKACEQRGIKMVGTGAGYDQLVKDPQEAANNAKILGSSFLMCACLDSASARQLHPRKRQKSRRGFQSDW